MRGSPCIHDLWYSWRHQIPALASRFRVVALDLRGYNLSDKPRRGYDVLSLSDDIRGAVDAFGERDSAVVGHDWGGGLAWEFAIRHPDYLRRLIILNAPHPALMARELRHPQQMLRSAYIGFFQLRGVAEQALERDGYASIWRTFRSADPERLWLADADIRCYVDAITRPGALESALAYYRLPQSRGFATLSPMHVVTTPTQVLWGERDPFLGTDLLDGLDRWVRDLHVHRFATAGHWLNQQEPERVNETLLDFLV